jgi:hypothetical protein
MARLRVKALLRAQLSLTGKLLDQLVPCGFVLYANIRLLDSLAKERLRQSLQISQTSRLNGQPCLPLVWLHLHMPPRLLD